MLWSAPRRLCPKWLYLLFIVDTRFTVEDIKGALLKQLKASKDTSIVVKKPEDENIHFTNYGNTVWTLQEGAGINKMKRGFKLFMR